MVIELGFILGMTALTRRAAVKDEACHPANKNRSFDKTSGAAYATRWV